MEDDSYVALRSVASSIELFFVAKVISKGITQGNKEDDNGHQIVSGEKYLTVEYLEKDHQRTNNTSFMISFMINCFPREPAQRRHIYNTSFQKEVAPAVICI